MLDMGYVEVKDHEKQFNDSWRIFNGSDWVHAIKTREQAVEQAELWGGTAIGLAKFNEKTGMNEYLEVMALGEKRQ